MEHLFSHNYVDIRKEWEHVVNGYREPEQGGTSAAVDVEYELRRLQLFNLKVEKLGRSRLVTYMEETGGTKLTFSGHRVDDGGFEMTVEREGPDEEMVDAVTLTLRMFIQKKEPISLRKMATAYDHLPVSPSLKEQFRQIHEAINEALDSPTYVAFNEVKITNREVQDIFLYGELAHVEDRKREVFETWRQMPALYCMLLNEFCTVIYRLISAVHAIRTINLAAIEELQGLQAGRKA